MAIIYILNQHDEIYFALCGAARMHYLQLSMNTVVLSTSVMSQID